MDPLLMDSLPLSAAMLDGLESTPVHVAVVPAVDMAVLTVAAPVTFVAQSAPTVAPLAGRLPSLFATPLQLAVVPAVEIAVLTVEAPDTLLDQSAP